MDPRLAGLCLVNGRQSSSLSIFDRSVAYGDGLFETLRIHHLRPLLASLHWDRLRRGLDRLQIPLESGIEQRDLAQLLELVASRGGHSGLVKLIVTRGEGARGFAPPAQPSPNILLSWHPLPEISPDRYRNGVDLSICRQRLPHRPWLAGLKHLNCLEYVLAKLELSADNWGDGVLLDVDGLLVETTSSNIFLVNDKRLSTPALHRCGVAGTLRRWVLDGRLQALGFDVSERDLQIGDLAFADEIFIGNSVTGILPVQSIDSQQWSPGPVTRLLQQQFAKLLDD